MPTTTDPLPPPASPQEDVTTTLYRAAIGPVSSAYYLPLFTRFEAADRASITWNTAASLLTLNWLLFRQLWGAALAYAGIVAGVFVFVLGIGRLVLHFSNTLQMALLLGFGFLAFVLPGLFGNVLLHAQCRKRMERALAANAKIADACAELTAQASTQTCGHGQCTPDKRKSATVASIRQVRCAGTPQPEKMAYAQASAQPPSKAAKGAGNARHSRPERRHSQPITATAPQANMVMCKPEIDTRCATPVARNTSQSARSMAF